MGLFSEYFIRVLINIILGAGGFGTGLGQSGHIKTLWAIEWDELAASTYRLVQMHTYSNSWLNRVQSESFRYSSL